MNTKTRSLTEAALITALICVIGFAGLYIPLMGLLSYFTFVPLIILGRRHGGGYVILALAAAAAIFAMLAGPLTALSLVLISGLSCAAMSILLSKGKQPYIVLAGGTLTALISTIALLGVAQLATGIPMAETAMQIFDESMKMQQSMFDAMKTDPAEAAAIAERMQQMKEQAVLLIPSVVIIGAVLSAFVNYWLATVILRRLRMSVPHISPFRELMLPKSVLLGTIIIYLLSLAAASMKIVDEAVLMGNVQTLMMFTFAVQGLAVVVWYMHRRSVSRILMAFAIIILLFSSLGFTILFMLGVSETVFRLRARAEAQSR